MTETFEIIEPIFRTYLLHNAALETLVDGCRWTEGPVWFADAAQLLFSDIPNNRILRWIEGVGASTWLQPSEFANGHTRDRLGRLVSCLHGRRAVVRTEFDGTRTVLAERYEGKRLNSPNDVVVKSDGSIWFTDPHYGIRLDYEGERAQQELACNVYRIDADNGHVTIVADSFSGPNGLCFSPDESRLYIAETGALFDTSVDPQIRRFDVLPGGKLGGERLFHKVDAGVADGFRCDEDGNLWTSAADGVHCISPDGVLLGKIRVPEKVGNVTFGGRFRSRLFICASTRVYAVYLNRRGVQWP